MIAAVSENGVIGINNESGGHLPWKNKYPEDLKRFKLLTMESTVIMGRKTFESIGSKPLPKRRNIVISSNYINNLGIECFKSFEQAALQFLEHENIWIIGGASLYSKGMSFCNEIDLTLIPENIYDSNAVYFPWINPTVFWMTSQEQGKDGLLHFKYQRNVGIETCPC